MTLFSGIALIFFLSGPPQADPVERVFPQVTDELLDNPWMGLAYSERLLEAGYYNINATESVYSAKQYDLGTGSKVGSSWDWSKVRNIFMRTGWNLLNSAEDTYDWTLFDQAFDYWSGQGKDMALRIVTDANITGIYIYDAGCPPWVYDKGVGFTEYLIDDAGRTYRAADLSDSVYQTELLKFNNAVVSHLKSEGYFNQVKYMDLRCYGAWGEHHSGYDWNNMNTRLSGISAAIDNTVNPFIDGGFDGMFFLSDSGEWREEMNLPLSWTLSEVDYSDYVMNSGFDTAYSHPQIAVRRDGFGRHIQTEYDGRHMLEQWRSSRKPLHAQIGGAYDNYETGLYTGMDGQAAIDQVVTYHANYFDGMFFLKDIFESAPEKIDPFIQDLGYRLFPVAVEYSGVIKQGSQWYVRHTWQNAACGRLPVPYNVKFYIMDGSTVKRSFHDYDTDLTTCVQGENPELISVFPCPTTDLEDGTYDLRMAIVDSNGMPRVQMPLADGDSLNRYKIGIITVDSSASAPELPDVQGFESGSLVGTGFAKSSAASVSSVGAIDGSYSVVAEVPQSTTWNTMLRTTDLLETGATYKVSFSYCLLSEQGGTVDDPGYMEFTARSPSAGTDADRGRTCWMDEAGTAPAVKTVYVTLGDHDDYRFQWSIRWGGKVALDNVLIEKMTDSEAFYSQNFESGQFSSGCWPFDYSGISTANALEGAYSVGGAVTYDTATLSPHWTGLLGCQPGFETNSTYTLSFSYKQLEAAEWGGYNYVTLKTPSGGTAESVPLLKWIDLAGDETRKTVTFTTGSRTDYRVVWGLRNGGSAVLDDITIIRND